MALGSWSPVRVRAATEESAIAQALAMVGAERDEASVEVIERGDKGVTVRIRPRPQDEPVTDAQASAEPEPIQAQVADALASEADDEAPELASEEVAEAVEADDEDDFASGDAPSLEQVIEDEAVLEPVLFEADDFPVRESDGASGGEEADDAPSLVAPEVRERARALAQEMLQRMALDVSASLSSRPFSAIEAGDPDAENRVYVAVDGPDVSILIGKHGATLQSFQYLLNLSLNNRGESSGATGDEAVRVVVDAGGYRSRRAEMLERMAFDTAARACREGRAIRMESMPAHERRLVHMFLRRDSSVSTGSEGREPQRFVVVAPAGQEFNSYEPQRSGYGARGGYGNRDGGRGYGGNRRGRR